MRLRPRRFFHTPEVMIIPMIDIMFFSSSFYDGHALHGAGEDSRCQSASNSP